MPWPWLSLTVLAQGGPVGQVGERVVAGHVGDPRLVAAALGNVLEGRDPAAALQRPVADGEDAPVRELPVDRAGLVGEQREARPLAQAVDRNFAPVTAARHQHRADLPLNRAEGQRLGGQSENLAVAVIADDEAGLGVEHAQSLRHVAERGLEALVLCDEAGIRGLQFRERRGQRLAGVLLAAHVGADAAIAEIGPVRGKARPAAHPEPAGAPVGMGIRVGEVAKLLPPQQGLAVGRPELGVAQVRRDGVARVSDELGGGAAEEPLDALAQIGEAPVRVDLPEPVGGDLREVFEEVSWHRTTGKIWCILRGMS
ncbi:hypothetical protein AEGHOMDF_1987 [Methylobacterium soli]|nr:hypothetical protein AEGHOMDF_1987 [Methylobacterium soli]